MKKSLIIIALLSIISNYSTAQDRKRHNIGLQYDIEWLTNGSRGYPSIGYNEEGIYAETCFPNYKYSLTYRTYFYKGLFIEPQFSLYSMKYDFLKARKIGIGVDADPNRPANPKYDFRNLVLNEDGYSGSLSIGYNLYLASKFSLDIFVRPTYSYATNATGYKDQDLLKEEIYKREYLSINGGFGINYRFLFLKVAAGSYLTDRFLENTDANKPITLSLGFGIKVGF